LKTALIFGCNGQDGSLLSRSLLKKGYKVIGLSRSNIKPSTNHLKLGIHDNIVRVEGNICEFETIASLIETHHPEEIYNLAGQSSVGESFRKPIETINSIVNGTINILEVIKKTSYSGKVFFAGSGEIFGNTQTPADLNHKQRPLSPYAIAKQTSFNLVKTYREINKLNCCTGVLFNHESHLRGEFFVTKKIINTAKAISKNKNSKLKLGNIDVIRDWGWAPEYVEAMQMMLNTEASNDQIICTGSPISLKIFISKVFSYYNLDWQEYIQIDKKFFRPNEIKQSFGNPEQIYNDLGWKAKVNFDSMIDKIINSSLD